MAPQYNKFGSQLSLKVDRDQSELDLQAWSSIWNSIHSSICSSIRSHAIATLAGQVFLGAEWEKQLNSENMEKENKRTEQTR